MSQTTLPEQPEIPACRRNGTVRRCAGPPTALAHAIPLPPDPEGARTQRHYTGHHTFVGDSPATCGICAAIAGHVNDCPPCQASLIRCIRKDDCQRAWDPFIRLIYIFAAEQARRLHAMTPADVDEAREVAEEKGMELILADSSFDAQVVLNGGRGRLKRLLWKSMWHKMLSHVRKSKPGTVFTVDPQPEGHGESGGHGKAESTVLDTTARTPGVDVAWRDPTGDTVASSDASAGLERIISDYRASLDDVNELVFALWYDVETTQEQISRFLLGALEQVEEQYKVNRRIGRFKKDLAERIADPTNGLDEETRRLAHRLFIDNKRTRRANRNSEGPPAGDAQDTTEELEDR